MPNTIYKYPTSVLVALYGGMIAAAAVLVGFGTYAISKSHIDHSYNYVGAFCIVLGASALYCAYDQYRKHLEISPGTDGIAANGFGSSKISIPWNAIQRIEKRRGYDQIWNKDINIYYVIAKHDRIRFDETIKNLDALLTEINVYLAKYDIEATFIDHGRNTQREIIRTTEDKTKRQKLIREGVRTRVSKL